jgi:glyoxylase-like metal-dependent hydrolase (beta-lactamase superfamily II)
MILECLVVGPIATNCYIVGNGPEVAIVDPGGDAEAIIAQLKKRRLRPTAIYITHGHADHILSVGELADAFPDIKIYIHKDESSFLENPSENLSVFLGEAVTTPKATGLLSDGDDADMGGLAFKVLHVPGHSPGGICFYHKPEKGEGILIAGDTVFEGSIGRTDFPHSNHNKFISKIKEKILTLPPDTMILPGHGPATTVRAEKDYNPFLS